MEEFIKLCSEESPVGDNERLRRIQSLLENGELDPATRHGSAGWYPIHYAARFGRGNIVQLLLSCSGCEVHMHTRGLKFTALHIASKYNQLEIVETLLRYMPSGAPPRRDREGNTPLHFASETGSLGIVNRLTNKYSKGSIREVNRSGSTPLGISVRFGQAEIARFLIRQEQSIGNPASTFHDFRSLFPQFKYKQSLDHPVNIFAMGNRQTGKSTLIKSIQTQGVLRLAIGAFMPTPGVEYHSGGVVPSDVSSSTYGRARFFELASCQQSTQENIFSEMKSGNAIFLVTLSFKQEMREMESTLLYWLCFIHHQLRLMETSTMPYVIVVGSFLFYHKLGAVRLDNRHRLHIVYHRVLAAHSELCSHFHFIGKFSMDCRRSESPGMRQLKGVLRRKGRELRPSGGQANIPSLCYVLSSALHAMRPTHSSLPIARLSEIEHKIAESTLTNNVSLFSLLPSQTEDLRLLLNMLEERKAVIVLRHLDRQDPWVIFDEFRLISLIDDTLITRAMRLSASSYFNPAIMTEEKLRHCLSPLSSSLNKDVLLNILHYFKITEVMAHGNDTRYFLPSVLKISPAAESTPLLSWNAIDSKYTLGFAQCILPKAKQIMPFFMPRFLYFLLYELYSLTEKDDFDPAIMSHSALYLSLAPLLEIYVTIDSSAIILYMQCSDNGVFSCLQYRNKFEAIIHQQRKLLQPKVSTEEYLVPMENLSFPVMNVKHILEKGIQVNKLKNVHIKQETMSSTDSMNKLNSFEPYRWLCKLKRAHLDNLLDPRLTNVEASKEFIRDLAKCVGENWSKMLDYSELLQDCYPSNSGGEPDTDESNNTKSSQQQPTYGRLLDLFSSMSIFQTTAELVSALKDPMTKFEASTTTASDSDGSQLMQLNTLTAQEEAVLKTESVSDLPVSSSTSSNSVYNGKYHVPNQESSPVSQHGVATPMTCSTSSDASSTTSIGMQYNVASLHTLDSIPSMTHLPHGVQFVTTSLAIKCDRKGGRYHNEVHNITVTIPPQAVREEAHIVVEFAVAVVGPFLFPDTLMPVSPIFWVRMRRDNGTEKLHKPLEISIPHTVHCGQHTKWLHILCSQSQGFTYGFERTHKLSKILLDRGILHTKLSKQQYFFCIAANCYPEIVSRTQYCVVKVAPKPEVIIDDSWKLYFFVTYALPAYVEMVKRQFGDNYTVDEKGFQFRLSTNIDPSISVKFLRETPELWTLTKEGTYRQIEASKVDVRNASNFEINKMNKLHLYPPNFTIAVNGYRATATSCVEFVFEGVAQTDLLYEMVLPVSSTRQKISFSSNADGTDNPYITQKGDNNEYQPEPYFQSPVGSLSSIQSEPVRGKQSTRAVSGSITPRQNRDEEKRSAMTVLIQNYNNIRTHLDNSTMRGELVQRRALTPDQAKDLLDCTASVANEKLFWFVVNGGVSGFEQFMQALAKTSEDHQGHRQILNDLRLDLKQVQSHSRSATHILRSLHPRNTTCSDSGAEH